MIKTRVNFAAIFFRSAGARFVASCLVLVASMLMSGCDRDAPTSSAKPSAMPISSTPDATVDKAQPIMPLADVRVGMRGYGLSVFNGVKIEPFAIEVTSVMGDFGPKRGAIWVRCTGARMQKNGLVSGMSGSPIYVWGPGETHQLGQGGRLIGAFAFGYGNSKDCYVGVQPIEYMRQVAQRALDQDQQDKPGSSTAAGSAHNSQLRRLLSLARRNGLDDEQSWRARAILDLIAPLDTQTDSSRAAAPLPPGPDIPGRVEHLQLPMQVGSPQLASVLAPLLEPLGLSPRAAPAGVQTGVPPPGVDIQQVRFEPGSVLAVPLAWGDLDLSASGTVTDVLPDGRVLAFGHAMNNQGSSTLPMATGFVHFVYPSRQTSFKLGGSGVIRGGLVRDEATGIVGMPDRPYDSAPIKIVVNMPGQTQRDYQYQVVHDRSLTPILAAIVAIESLAAVQGMPPDNTLRLRTKLTFDGGFELVLDSLRPNAGNFDVLMAIMAPIDIMINNDFQSAKLQAMQLTMDVEPKRRQGYLIHARLDRDRVAPGDTLGITLTVQAYHEQPQEHRIEFVVPDDLPDGNYPLFIADPNTYVRQMMSNRPHLGAVTNITELHEILQLILAVPDDVFYIMLQRPQQQLALGRVEMPNLPSSRHALITTALSTLASPYRETIDQVVPMGVVTRGSHRFQITIDNTLRPRN